MNARQAQSLLGLIADLYTLISTESEKPPQNLQVQSPQAPEKNGLERPVAVHSEREKVTHGDSR